jgi:hypothetical protein
LNGRIYIELINGPMLFDHKSTPAEYSAGLKLTIERGWLGPHRSRTFVRFTQAGRICMPEECGRAAIIPAGQMFEAVASYWNLSQEEAFFSVANL